MFSIIFSVLTLVAGAQSQSCPQDDSILHISQPGDVIIGALFKIHELAEDGTTCTNMTDQWQIQDFPQGGAPTPKIAIIFHIFTENCMKMKEFGPPGGGARPWRPPLDPPMQMEPRYRGWRRSFTPLRESTNKIWSLRSNLVRH